MSPERIYPVPGDPDENVRRHIARYEFAAGFIPAGVAALDCACGSGYGTEILATRASEVFGVDRSAEAIGYARERHARPNIVYIRMPMEELRFPPGLSRPAGGLGAVVTLETLEHVPLNVAHRFLRDHGRWLIPGGVLVASSPMLRYRDGQPYITSPFHVNEMPKAGLLAMFEELLPGSGWVKHYYRQEQEAFVPLLDEDTGFCVLVARKRPQSAKE
jgi:2-polyprenyl-3-methyl-5-hydroxy-6-metoxy-1,4-benzoquinol methylase